MLEVWIVSVEGWSSWPSRMISFWALMNVVDRLFWFTYYDWSQTCWRILTSLFVHLYRCDNYRTNFRCEFDCFPFSWQRIHPLSTPQLIRDQCLPSQIHRVPPFSRMINLACKMVVFILWLLMFRPIRNDRECEVKDEGRLAKLTRLFVVSRPFTTTTNAGN